MSLIKALAISDIHINRSRRLDDVESALERIIPLIVGRQVAKLFVLGDVWTSRRPTSTELAIFERWLDKVRGRVEVYLLKGNHDESPTGEHSYHMVEAFNLRGVKVLDNPSVIDNIFLGHLLLFGAKIGHDSWENNTGLTAKELLLKYPNHRAYICGDVHAPQELNENPPVLYCGSIERVDFSERNDEKRAIYFEYDTNDKLSFKWESMPLKTRPMIQYDIDLSKALPTFKLKDIGDAIVKIIYHGTPTQMKKVAKADTWHNSIRGYCKELIVQHDVITEIVARDERVNESITPQKALELYLEQVGELSAEEKADIFKLGVDLIDASTDE